MDIPLNSIKPNYNGIMPLEHFPITIGMIPSSYLLSLTYEEQLLWLCWFFENKLLPAFNENTQTVAELQQLYLDLKKYVDDYFNNLDVQDEINNKLDEMAQNGELQEIIAQFINSNALWCFNTVNDMKQATNLIEGSSAITLGYHSINDNGSAKYIIRTKNENDNIDNKRIIPLLNNNLIAVLVENNSINIKQLGAYGDNNHDDTEIIQFAINNYNNIYIPKGTYKLTNSLNIRQGKTIKGEGMFNSVINYTGEDIAVKILYTGYAKTLIEDISINKGIGYIEGDITSVGIDIEYNSDINRNVTNLQINRVSVRYFAYNFNSIYSNGMTYSSFNDCLFQNGYCNARIYSGFTNSFNRCSFSNAKNIGLICRAGEGNFQECSFENNLKGVQITNAGGKFCFNNCFFENIKNDDETMYLFYIEDNIEQDAINEINIIGCHFYGTYNQMYIARTVNTNIIGCTFKHPGNRCLSLPNADSVRKEINLIGNVFDVEPNVEGKNISVPNTDSGWIAIDTSEESIGSISDFKIRKVGRNVYLSGTITGVTDDIINQNFNTLIPEGFRPKKALELLTPMKSGNSYDSIALIRIDSNYGTFKVRGATKSILSNYTINLDNIYYCI